jgi:transposase
MVTTRKSTIALTGLNAAANALDLISAYAAERADPPRVGDRARPDTSGPAGEPVRTDRSLPRSPRPPRSGSESRCTACPVSRYSPAASAIELCGEAAHRESGAPIWDDSGSAGDRVSRQTAHYWLARYEAGGSESLRARPRGKAVPRTVTPAVRARVLALKDESPKRSAAKVARVYAAESGERIHRSTVWAVLKKVGSDHARAARAPCLRAGRAQLR